MQDKNSYTSLTRLRHNSPTTDKSLKLSNYIQQVTSFDPPTQCAQHCHDSVGYICIDCRYKCLCGTCLQEGSHKSHHVKGIEKGSRIVERALSEALIRLRSKSDLLTNLKDYMKVRKSEIFQQNKEYQKTFHINFDGIFTDLEQRRRTINQQIQSHRKSTDSIIDSLIEQINGESVMTLEVINTVESNVEKFKSDPASLCLFYEGKNLELENLVGQSAARFSLFKNQVPDINWSINLQIFDNLKSKIRSLELETTVDNITLTSDFYDYKKGAVKKQATKFQKMKDLHFLACKTPKAIEGNRNTVNNFRSPGTNLGKKRNQSGKMNSMPASPSKQKKSTGKAKGEEVGKKFKKNKK